MKKINYFMIILAACVFSDQLTKFFASKLTASVPIIKNFLHLTFVTNQGVLFGLFPGHNSLFVWLYVIVLGLLIYCYDKFPQDKFSKVMLALVFAGVVGNFIDRIAFGHVIDFIDFRVWPVFNFADIFLNAGIIGILGKSIIESLKNKKST